jgi:hypothetical protein
MDGANAELGQATTSELSRFCLIQSPVPHRDRFGDHETPNQEEGANDE